MSLVTEKADQTIQEWLQGLFNKLNQVNNIHIVGYVFANGILTALATTGYLGSKSIDPFSLEGGLYALNFFMVMLFAASKFNPTLKYLGKLFVSGLIGYAAFWQIMSMYEATEYFKPFISPGQGFGLFLFTMGMIGALIFAFTGHEDRQDIESFGITPAELDEMRNAVQIVNNLPQDVINNYSQVN